MSDERELSLAMVLIHGEAALDPDAWRKALERFALPIRGEVSVRSGAMSVELEDGGLLAVGHVPIPLDGLESHRVPNALWPDAATTIDTHTGHMMVSVIGGEDGLPRRMVLTAATVATASCLEALGVYWPDVPHVTRTDIAHSTLEGAHGHGDLPVPLWVAVQLSRLRDGRLAALTQGLPSFGHQDLHIISSKMGPQEIWGQAMSIAEYVISSGAKLQAGQTLGSSDEQRLPIVASSSPRSEDTTVLRIEFP